MVESVGIVGRNPAAAAIEAALSDADAESERIGIEAAGSVDLLAVVGDTGDRVFAGANDRRAEPWIAVELGGIGGRSVPDVDAGVSVLGMEPCFSCLRSRVAANHEGEEHAPKTDPSDARFAGAIAGRLAISITEGEEAAGRVIELPYRERRLLGAPNCSCDTGRDWTPHRDHEPVGLEGTADRAERAVDGRLGLVSEVGEIDSFPTPYYLAGLCETTAFGEGSANEHAAGVAEDWDAAFVKAIGEALERYAAAIYREADFETAPASDLDGAVSPGAFVLPEEGYDPPDPETLIAWVEGADLRDGRDVRLPAEFVHFPPPDRRHKPSITTGLGLGTSGVDALLSGLYETIERDATTIAWYSTFEPLELDVDDGGFERLARRARSEGLAVTPLLMTQDVDVPVVSAAVHREEWPRFAVGSAGDLDPGAAARGALAEAVQNWMELRRMGPDRAAEEESALARYADRPREAEAFLDTTGELSATDLADDAELGGEAELDAVLDRLAGAGLDAYASRLTTRDVAELGFEVVRALVPQAQPRFLGERYFGERARQVPRDLGYRARFDRPRDPYP